jgi:hypothetical protein
MISPGCAGHAPHCDEILDAAQAHAMSLARSELSMNVNAEGSTVRHWTLNVCETVA